MAKRLTVFEMVDFELGAVMEIVGLVVSGARRTGVGVATAMGREQEAVLPPFEPRHDQRY